MAKARRKAAKRKTAKPAAGKLKKTAKKAKRKMAKSKKKAET